MTALKKQAQKEQYSPSIICHEHAMAPQTGKKININRAETKTSPERLKLHTLHERNAILCSSQHPKGTDLPRSSTTSYS